MTARIGVHPKSPRRIRPGGVYVGVGTEQNFTYIAAIHPSIAFIVDIRRDNLLEHLMYKALFELSPDRADFISRLFSRKRPSVLNANSSAAALFKAYESVESDPVLFQESLDAVFNQLVNEHRFPLSDADKGRLAGFMSAFRTAGPFELKGSGDKHLTYAESATAADAGWPYSQLSCFRSQLQIRAEPRKAKSGRSARRRLRRP